MKFEIKELTSTKLCYFEVGFNGDCIKKLKQEIGNVNAFSIGFETLNLGEKLYGNSKKQSVEIQRENARKIIKLFKTCVAIVKVLKRCKKDFDGTFYVAGLKEKKNNNDFMLMALLDTKFNYGIFKRMGAAVVYACDYLDKENEINNMCDFKNNKCVSHRENNIDKNTGCCPSFCKYTECKTCTIKNISCKLFMCDYLEDRGYYFTPHTIPILRRHLSVLERFICTGMLFKTTKKTIKKLWFIRWFLILFGVLFIGLLIL